MNKINIPDSVKSVIIAELRHNESDSMTDYFGYRTEKVVYLSWSKHERDLFPELRKAAAKFEETKKYAIKPIKPENADEFWRPLDEHREKYSLGDGFYLGNSRYSGWTVQKKRLSQKTIEQMNIAVNEGRFLCDQVEVKETIEEIEVTEGEINIIEYSSKAIAVIGDTRPIKDKLKSLGGSFNFRLSCGPGWIFPKSKLEELQKVFG